MESVTKIVL